MAASFKQVTALTRGLEVLRATSMLRGGTVGAIHKVTGLDKATIVRFLETLVSEGYVAKSGSEDLPKYIVTRKVMQLSFGFVLNNEVSRVGGMLLDTYAEKLKWPVTVMVFDGDAMVVAAARGDVRGLDTIRQPGFRFPMLVSAAGLSYLAFLPIEDRNRILKSLARTTDVEGWNSLARNRQDMEKLFTKIRRQGYATGENDYYQRRHDGVIWGVSVPIIGRDMIYGVIGLMILTHVRRPGEGLTGFVSTLKEFAARTAKTLDDLGTIAPNE